MRSDDGLVENITEEVEAIARASTWSKRSLKRRNIALGVSILVLAGLLIVWTQRKPIARNFVADELERRGVDARYDITRIGFRTQRLENISLGDSRRPDLTADWAEITTSIGFGTVKITGMRAGGVRLRGRLVDGAFSFGEIDKLLPAPSGEPFSLPDFDVSLQDARMRLDLPNGPIGLKLEGQGNLTGGFKGKLAAVTPSLNFGDCALSGATAWLDLSVTNRQPTVSGPVRAQAFACKAAGLALISPETHVNARLNEALNSWKGSARLQLDRASLAGYELESVNGAVGFDGGRRGTNGGVDISARTLSAGPISGQHLRLDGKYTLGKQRGGGQLVALGGKVSLEKAVLAPAMLTRIASYGDAAAGSPVAPLVKALTEAAVRAGQAARIDGDFAMEQAGGKGSLKIAALSVLSESGMRLALTGANQAVGLAWPGNGAVQVNGRLSLGGGGFPAADVQLQQEAPGAAIRGVANVQPYVAGGAQLALTPVKFDAGPDGRTRFDTRVTLDGPLGDGRVAGLTLPVNGRLDGRGGVTINPGCAPLSFASLTAAGLVLGANRMTLCPQEGAALFALAPGGRMRGGARVERPRLTGRIGSNPVTLAADGLQFALSSMDLAAQNVAVRLTSETAVTRLDIGSLQGRFGAKGGAGRFAGLGGQIGAVPLVISQAAGDWGFAGGALKLAGRLRVTDAAAEPRFNALSSDDFTLDLVDGRIAARGLLREARTNTAITNVTIAHVLGNGVGHATLDVPGIAFGEGFQPDALTPLTLGVIANVTGSVKGQGRIDWTTNGATSTGSFSTNGTNLAAAFGPVTNLSTEIRFTDMLGLITAPGQRATVGEINPGIPVKDGVILYQLLPEQRVRIEGGDWPFASGHLVLDPTTLDMAATKPRNLTFRVNGLNAAAFLESFEFQNINATGVFDGILPMVFDEKGGRIVDGRLAVREGGGNLAYIGEVSKEDLGTWGNFAFDALRSVNYRTLEILLNGDLAGEMVTQINFTGLSQGEGTKSNFLTRKIAQLPIKFNVRIAAPFRQLVFSARSLYDPKMLIEQNLGALMDAEALGPNPSSGEMPDSAVQPSESENKP